MWQDITAQRFHERVRAPAVYDDVTGSLISYDPGTSPPCSKSHCFLGLTSGVDPVRYSEPTVFENYVHDIYIDNTHVELSLWDTAGQEEFDRLRSLSYDDTHAIMLCFSVDSPDSLENVETKWVSEIAENCPGVKLVLVALKCDLRKKDDDEEEAQPEKPLIQYDEGLKVAERIKALRYLGI